MPTRKIIFIFVILVLLIGAGIAGWQAYLPVKEDNESAQSYSDLRQYVYRPSIPQETEPPGEGQIESQEPAESQPTSTPIPADEDIKVDFAALKKINPDIVAWLTIPGTNIDYPIARHDDNDYYLHHLFTGEWNSSGCLFMDYRNEPDFSDPHTIIYGHHMDNGTMFQNLMGYKNQEFYDRHPTGQLITPDGSYTVEFFAGYVANVEDNAWDISFPSKEEFTTWVNGAKERSTFSSAVKLAAGDHIITLCTCSYEFYNARFVVLGKITQN